MADLHLNKQHKFFYFQTRISWSQDAEIDDQGHSILWENTLKILNELHLESEIDIYGLVYEAETLHILFSTPRFNENILILDWEFRLKTKISVNFDRPILCEPVSGIDELKIKLIDIYRSQCEVVQNSIRWSSSFNSLKLIIEGHRYAGLFKDPLRVVFQPNALFQIGRRPSNARAY